MTKILIIAAAFYFCLLAVMYIFQRRLLYFPDKQILPPSSYGLEGFADHIGNAADGCDIQIWHKKATPGFPTILYLHGNAGNLGNRAPTFKSFADKGFGVFALSYRGYGKSAGKPTERGLYRDARSALTYLQFEFGVPMYQIIVYGESLGSGVAVKMATEHRPGGVILEAPYTSVANRAAEIYSFIPVHLLLKDHFNSSKLIERVKSPLLILHGEKDETIPVAHGRALFEMANSPKKGVFFPQFGHNDFDREIISAHVLDFAKEHKLIRK